ncbi:hypothetical protein ACFOMD_01245 [Sphingoaurantiacus capsulatus]|uniref:Uncharacterized protein n=2 Tax=Sphingoaurantiacus capsulatus TaxID=1771310 RepID=A0ABV7X5T6_9SPHN
MSEKVSDISFFEIIANEEQRAVYGKAVKVAAGSRSYREVIDAAAQATRLPDDGDGISFEPGPGPERALDIVETRRTGSFAYAFRLNATLRGERRLKFDPAAPIVVLPHHSADDAAPFITAAASHSGENDGWASFVCDVGAARSSKLAQRIRDAAEKAQKDAPGALHHPVPWLCVAFRLNVIDPVLGAAPWVMPTEQDDDHGAILTHGGVHPPDVSFVRIRL